MTGNANLQKHRYTTEHFPLVIELFCMRQEEKSIQSIASSWLDDNRFMTCSEYARRCISSWADPIFGDDGLARVMAWAASGNSISLVSRLYEIGASVDVDECGESPLAYAINSGAEEIALRLVLLGADTNSICSSGLTPLHMAVKRGMLDVVVAMLDAGVDTKIKTLDDYQSAYELALEAGNEELCRLLRVRGIA